MRSFIVLPNFNGVAAGQTATMTLPVGGITYHKIVLAYNCTNAGNGNQANTEAHITGVRLKVNGKVQRTFSAKQLDLINGFYNRPFNQIGTAGALEIFLSEPWRRTPNGEDVLAWGMADVQTFQIEVDIAAAATGPTITPHAEVEYVARPMGLITKWRTYNQNVSATGINTNNTLPKIPTEAYQAIHAFPTNPTDITDVEVKVDQVSRLKGLQGDLALLYQSGIIEKYTPNTNMFHVVFDRTGRVSDALAMTYGSGPNKGSVVGDFRIDWDMNAANSFNFVAHVLGPRD